IDAKKLQAWNAGRNQSPSPPLAECWRGVASGARPPWEGFRGRLVERKTLRCWELVPGHDPVLLALAVRPVRRRAMADRLDGRHLHRRAVGCGACRIRDLGGVSEPDRRAMAHRLALA